jgi:hypothetical protein
VIIKQLKEINNGKNEQKGKFDKKIKIHIYWTKKLMIFFLKKKKKMGQLYAKNGIILEQIPKISPKKQF